MRLMIVPLFSTLIFLNACTRTINCCPAVVGSVIENPRTVGDYVVNAKVYEQAYNMCMCK